MSLNCAIIMGRLTAMPELRTTASGIAVTTFCVAVDRNYVKEGEERQTDFINVVAWRQSAAFVTRYFEKGQPICIKGAIQTRNYEDKNGNKRTAVEIVADSISFCGDKKKEDAEKDKSVPQGFTELPTDIDDDGLPF